MNFASDNWAGAHPRISAGLIDHAAGYAPAYGTSSLDKEVAETFSRIFERQVAVFFVATGTAANALSLTARSKPGGLSFCHREAHVVRDECGAAEYLAGGARLCAVDGPLGRIDPAGLDTAIGRFMPESVHAGRPAAVSITQATEAGTVYGLDDIEAISATAARYRLPVHMDGARFANALVSLGATPAEMTWKRGIDMVSFGGTKNGCWCAEAVVLFDPDWAGEFQFLRKRAGQLFSKSRFVAAQFEAYFSDGLWLETARHANVMAARLAGHIRESRAARLAWEPQANMVFAILPQPAVASLRASGAHFHEQHQPRGFPGGPGAGEVLCRLVTSFATSAGDVDRFAQSLDVARQ